MLRQRLIGEFAKPNTLSIVNYHRVLEKPDPLFPAEHTIETFRTELKWLRASFTVLPLLEANERRLSGTLPRRALAITFDDGYVDQVDIAMPLVREAGLTATFFVCSASLQPESRMWNDQVIEAVRVFRPEHIGPLQELIPAAAQLGLERFVAHGRVDQSKVVGPIVLLFKYLPSAERLSKIHDFMGIVGISGLPGLMIGAEGVRALRNGGMEVGGHTTTHPILANMTYPEARKEIADNKAWLEQCLGEEVRSFAYPNGKPVSDYNADSRKAAEDAGFALAVTTAKGVSDKSTDSFQLPRFTPWDKTPNKFVARLALNTRQRDYDKLPATPLSR